jgi:hypothetical protein
MKNLKKMNKIMLIITLFLFSYSCIYTNFLEEPTFVRYVPNYDNANVAFPQYDPDGSNKTYYPTDENTILASDNFHDYVPLYGILLQYLFVLTILLSPGFFISTFIMNIFLILKERKNLGIKWYCFLILAYVVIVFCFFNTEIMD